nr:reverse transcriptase domain-containing protein [Tanacetum cinerariifolium]
MSSLGYGKTDLHHLDADKKIKEEGKEICSIGWVVEEEVCPHTQKSAIRVLVYEERSRSQKVKTVKGDIGSQSRENKSHASKRKIYLNRGHARKQIPSPLESTTSNYKKVAVKVECWAMPTWCHMFNSTFTGSAKNHQPELIKRLHDNILNSVDEMMRVTTSFLRGEAPSRSEKPNDSNYRTPHWLQWRNQMANGTNTIASKNRRCEAFHLYMDEFGSSKISVSIQWDHKKAKSEEYSSKERIKVAIHPKHPEQTIAIGSTLTDEGHKALCDLLRRSLGVFAWKPADMKGVPQHIAKKQTKCT